MQQIFSKSNKKPVYAIPDDISGDSPRSRTASVSSDTPQGTHKKKHFFSWGNKKTPPQNPSIGSIAEYSLSPNEDEPDEETNPYGWVSYTPTETQKPFFPLPVFTPNRNRMVSVAETPNLLQTMEEEDFIWVGDSKKEQTRPLMVCPSFWKNCLTDGLFKGIYTANWGMRVLYAVFIYRSTRGGLEQICQDLSLNPSIVVHMLNSSAAIFLTAFKTFEELSTHLPQNRLTQASESKAYFYGKFSKLNVSLSFFAFGILALPYLDTIASFSGNSKNALFISSSIPIALHTLQEMQLHHETLQQQSETLVKFYENSNFRQFLTPAFWRELILQTGSLSREDIRKFCRDLAKKLDIGRSSVCHAAYFAVMSYYILRMIEDDVPDVSEQIKTQLQSLLYGLASVTGYVSLLVRAEGIVSEYFLSAQKKAKLASSGVDLDEVEENTNHTILENSEYLSMGIHSMLGGVGTGMLSSALLDGFSKTTQAITATGIGIFSAGMSFYAQIQKKRLHLASHHLLKTEKAEEIKTLPNPPTSSHLFAQIQKKLAAGITNLEGEMVIRSAENFAYAQIGINAMARFAECVAYYQFVSFSFSKALPGLIQRFGFALATGLPVTTRDYNRWEEMISHTFDQIRTKYYLEEEIHKTEREAKYQSKTTKRLYRALCAIKDFTTAILLKSPADYNSQVLLKILDYLNRFETEENPVLAWITPTATLYSPPDIRLSILTSPQTPEHRISTESKQSSRPSIPSKNSTSTPPRETTGLLEDISHPQHDSDSMLPEI